MLTVGVGHNRDQAHIGHRGALGRPFPLTHIHAGGTRLLPGAASATGGAVRRQGGGDEGAGDGHARRGLARHRNSATAGSRSHGEAAWQGRRNQRAAGREADSLEHIAFQGVRCSIRGHGSRELSMKIVTVEQMAALEAASERAGVSTDRLMENAGHAIANQATEMLDGSRDASVLGSGRAGQQRRRRPCGGAFASPRRS